MKKTILFTLFLTIFATCLPAQDFSFPDLNGFKKITKYPVYLPENLWDFINGAADTYLALGFEDLHVAEYKKGKDVIKLEIFRHSSHTMAFGIYASERSPSFRYVNLGSQGYITDGAINFFKGNYYVKIRTYSKKAKTLSSAESLAERISGMLEGETEMPALLSRFPAEGKKINEETYVDESVLGHQFLNKAFKAVYESGNDNFSIFLIKFETPAAALKTAATYLASAGLEAGQQDNTKYMFTDGYNGTIFLSWKEELMVIISGLAKDQADIAERYSSEILK